jgi:hypothetical protein
MQEAVIKTNQQTDRFTVGNTVFEACKQYWKVAAPTLTDRDLACSLVRTAVSGSQGGISGKRAGLICSLMTECDATVLTGNSCSLNVSNTVGSLDMCTVQGINSGNLVAGISQSTGKRPCEGWHKQQSITKKRRTLASYQR